MKLTTRCVAAALAVSLTQITGWAAEEAAVKEEAAEAISAEAKTDDSAKDNKKWDVENPPGEEKTIVIDTNEST